MVAVGIAVVTSLAVVVATGMLSTRQTDGADNRAYTSSGDWSVGNWKGQCVQAELINGFSMNGSSLRLSVLCDNGWGSTAEAMQQSITRLPIVGETPRPAIGTSDTSKGSAAKMRHSRGSPRMEVGSRPKVDRRCRTRPTEGKPFIGRRVVK